MSRVYLFFFSTFLSCVIKFAFYVLCTLSTNRSILKKQYLNMAHLPMMDILSAYNGMHYLCLSGWAS